MNLREAQAAGIAPWDNVVEVKSDTIVFLDRYPCTPGHRLYVPKDDHPNHIARAMEDALADGNAMVHEGLCDGFNIGYNSGEAAGQTVMYPYPAKVTIVNSITAVLWRHPARQILPPML